MSIQQDRIVDIPDNRVRYFGTRGKMLLPSPATVAALIKKIPERKLLTTDLLRRELAQQFEVEGVCPVTTQKALKAVAHDAGASAAYWRVIKKDGGLFATFPGGVQDQATRLKNEGFTIVVAGKALRVTAYEEHLLRFA